MNFRIMYMNPYKGSPKKTRKEKKLTYAPRDTLDLTFDLMMAC